MAEKYVMRAPHKYSGWAGAGSSVMLQWPAGMPGASRAPARPASRRAHDGTGATGPAPASAWARIEARRCTGSAICVPSSTARHAGASAAPGRAAPAASGGPGAGIGTTAVRLCNSGSSPCASR